jgi:hypothetical protein
MPQRVFQHALLDRDLCVRVDVLHRAATTGAGMQASVRTAGRDAQHGPALDADHAARLVTRLVLPSLVDHALARKRALDEHRLALSVRDAASLLVERLDLGGKLVACPGT